MASLYFDSTHHSMILTLFVLTLTTTTMIGGSSAHYLSPTYYSETCPGALAAIRAQVQLALAREKRLGASIVRLFFHDCFVLGCDGSLLLDDTPTFRGEKTARPNNNSVRGFEVIDQIKAKVESLCPGVVSCADIVAVAARDSVVLLGGPNWDVKLGRRDSRTASFTIADTGALPGPQSNLSNLFTRFRNVGLSPKDMVALSGAHTIGLARCVSFRPHIYNDTNIDSTFAKRRQAICPRTVGVGDNNLASLDFQTPSSFDNRYFQHLVVKKGLLHSDQVLYDGGSTDSLVITYSKNQNIFFSDFVQAMIKMGDNNPLLTPKGEIRKNCRRIN